MFSVFVFLDTTPATVYPSIPHNGFKKCIRKKIKDKDFLMILDEIIDSTDNVRDVSSKLTNKIGMVKELILLNIMVNTLE